MCQFFSCVSDGTGKVFYFNAEQRAGLRKSNPNHYEPDSHTSIADFYGHKGAAEDKLNKYEYNPLTKEFVIDQLNTKNDSKKIEKFCRGLDFATVAPELIIKPIFHPLKHKKRKRVSQMDIDLLIKWDSVRNSVWDGVWDSVWASVRAGVWNSAWTSVRNSVGNSVRDSVRNSVRNSVWGGVRNSAWAGVGDSVGVYVSSFFNLPKGENPFQPCIDLWHRGVVPSFDGTTWRLHGHKGKVLKEITQEELRKQK